MGQMDRAERRRRAERAQERHDRQWRELYEYEPHQPGRGRKLSHMDCGTCHPGARPEPEWDEEAEPHQLSRRRNPKTIVVEYRRVKEHESALSTPHWSEWKKYATIEAACKAVAALNHSWQHGSSGLWEFRLQPGQEQA